MKSSVKVESKKFSVSTNVPQAGTHVIKTNTPLEFVPFFDRDGKPILDPQSGLQRGGLRLNGADAVKCSALGVCTLTKTATGYDCEIPKDFTVKVSTFRNEGEDFNRYLYELV